MITIDVEAGYCFASARARTSAQSVARTAILARLAARGIPIEMLQFHGTGLQFAAQSQFSEAVRSHVREAGLEWKGVSACAKIRVSGSAVRSSAGMFYSSFVVLLEREIPVLHFSDSDTTMSLIVPEAYGDAAVAVLRAHLGAEPDTTDHASIDFDAVRRRVRAGKREAVLGIRQAKLLTFLLANAGRVIAAEEVAAHVLGGDGAHRLMTLRVHVHNLRKKIEIDPERPRHLVTIPNQGYLFLE